MKKLLIFFIFLTLIFTAQAFCPVFFQGYLGRSIYNSKGMFQTGIHFMPKKTPLVLGLEYNYYKQNKKYEWPGIGNYNFQRKVQIMNFSFGFQLMKRRRINPFIGLIYNYSIFNGKLITDNSTLKQFLLNNYYFEKGNIFFLIKTNLKLTNTFSIYLSANLIKLKKGLTEGLFAYGLTYNIISKE